MTRRFNFDQDYYHRYYLDPGTRVADAKETARHTAFVASYLRYLELPVRRILDMGCGLGPWRDAARVHFPNARYVGVEYSQYLCDIYGWAQGSVVDYRARTPFDFVICNDVLQYLEDKAAARAMTNLDRLCRGVLYFGALTVGDWQHNCDRKRTDGDVYLRTAQWYRERLSPAFGNLGGGMFLKRDADVVLYELECLD